MALVLKDRVKETSTTAGTGTLTLAGAVSGFQSFAAVGNGNTTYYAIVDPITGDWEVGLGTYTSSGTTLSRTTVLSSSNSGSLVPFASNPKDVFVTYPSEKSVYEDASNVVNATSFGAITATSAALTTGTVSTTPASNTDIANKQYVDGLVTQGISYHEPVYVESPDTTGNLNATYNNGASGVGATLTNAGTQVALTVDGILMTVGKRVLIYNQTNATQNGVYTVTTVGDGSTNWVLTRSADANTYGLRDPNALGYNDAFFVTNGNTGAGETYVCTTTGTITFGTTNITFAQISSAQVYTAGTGLNLSPATTFNISNTGVSANTYGSASAVPVFAVNAQGQITGVTNTNIAISGSAVSGNIAGSAGSVANALTLGTYLTGGTYNGSAAVTATVDATSANTASKVVARDSSGNFSAGTITATLNGTATSTASATNLSGGAANQIAYQSATNTTAFATAPSASNQVLNWNGSAFTWSAGTISGVPLGSNLNSLTAGTYLTGTAYNGSAAQTWTVDATSANTASKVVARDASGNFSAGTITAALTGNATTATTATNQSGGTVNATTGAFSGSVTVTGTGVVTLSNNGDITAYRSGGNSGVLFLNSAQTRYLYWDGGTYYLPGAQLSINGSTALNAGNYNSYAPTLTGTGASGTWGINITGSSGSTSGNAATASRVTGGNLNPASTSFNNALISASGSNRVVTFDGNGYTPSVWWSNGSRAYGAIDAVDPGLAFWANNGTSWQQQMQVNYGNVTINTDIRSPIYYDANDTGYYIDPASTSNSALRMRGGALFGPNVTWGQYLYVGTDGNVDINTATVAVTNGNLHLDARNGYIMYLNNYATSSYTVANQSIRSPIFYDYDNTGYYCDPASTTFLYSLQLSGATYFRPNSWIELNGNYGIFSTAYNGAHFLANASSSYGAWRMLGNRNGWGGIYDEYSGVNIPMFDSGGNGGFYRESAGRWYQYYNYSNNCTAFGTSTTASGYNIYCPTGVYSGGRVDGTIFYDTNNTGYYLDPNGTSNVSMNCTGVWYYLSNFNTGSGSNAPLQAFSSGGSGAVMSFHRGGYYAVNFGLDSDNVMRIGGWSASANLFQMDMSGNLTMAANVTAYSDETLKKDWADMPSDFVPRLARVKSGTYTRIDNEMRQIGVGAQSLRPLMEEAVFENADGTLSVAYGNAAMASSVELARYVTALEQRISQLEARI